MSKLEKGTLYWLTDPGQVAVADGYNVRQDLDLKTLAKSIEEYGVRQPLIAIRQNNKAQPFVLQDGHRRHAVVTAIADKGEDVRFPLIVLDDHEIEVDANVELAISSMLGKALNSMEESDLCERLIKTEGVKTQSQAGALIGKSGAWVGQKLKLQGLSGKCQKALRVGKITFDYAIEIIRKAGEDHDEQDKRLERVMTQLAKRKEAEKATKDATGKGKDAKAKRAAAQKEKKAAQKGAKNASGATSRPSKKELKGLAAMYEIRYAEKHTDPVEILSAALNYAAGEMTEDQLFKTMAQFFGIEGEWSEVRAEVEAEQTAKVEAEKAEAKVAKQATKSKGGKKKKKSNGVNANPPAKPNVPAKKKTKSKKKKGKKKTADSASA